MVLVSTASYRVRTLQALTGLSFFIYELGSQFLNCRLCVWVESLVPRSPEPATLGQQVEQVMRRVGPLCGGYLQVTDGQGKAGGDQGL